MAQIDTCAKCGDSQKRNRGHEPYRLVESYDYFNPPVRETVCPKCARELERDKKVFGTHSMKLPDDVGHVEQ